MRILIATVGSHGDVVPYTGLGARLREAGHVVSLATHTRFAALVSVAGLEFRALPVDPMAALTTEGGQRLVRARSAALEVAELIRLGRQLMPALGEGVLSAAPGKYPTDPSRRRPTGVSRLAHERLLTGGCELPTTIAEAAPDRAHRIVGLWQPTPMRPATFLGLGYLHEDALTEWPISPAFHRHLPPVPAVG